MAQQFKLVIKLGNAAMTDAPAIAEALRDVVVDLSNLYTGCDPIENTAPGEYGTKIYDYNGNLVGSWAVEDVAD